MKYKEPLTYSTMMNSRDASGIYHAADERERAFGAPPIELQELRTNPTQIGIFLFTKRLYEVVSATLADNSHVIFHHVTLKLGGPHELVTVPVEPLEEVVRLELG